METQQPKSISIDGVEIPTCLHIFEIQVKNNRHFEIVRNVIFVLAVAVCIESVILFAILLKL